MKENLKTGFFYNKCSQDCLKTRKYYKIKEYFKKTSTVIDFKIRNFKNFQSNILFYFFFIKRNGKFTGYQPEFASFLENHI